MDSSTALTDQSASGPSTPPALATPTTTSAVAAATPRLRDTDAGVSTADETPASDMVDALAHPTLCCAIAHESGGFVQLVDAMPRCVQSPKAGGLGPEAAIVQAARISYGAGTRTAQGDEALIRFLFRHEHMTPFEMISLKFRVRAPLFTARQWMRHRTGAFNEESARYSRIDTTFYAPAPVDVRAQSTTNRQGSGAPLAPADVDSFLEDVDIRYSEAAGTYSRALDAGVSREIARIVLPEGRFTKFYWAVNLRNLFGFLKLRMAPDAQDNIRWYAHAIHTILAAYCPLAVKAFDDYTLNAVTLSALELQAFRSGIAPPEMSKREIVEWEAKRGKLGLPGAARVALGSEPAPAASPTS